MTRNENVPQTCLITLHLLWRKKMFFFCFFTLQQRTLSIEVIRVHLVRTHDIISTLEHCERAPMFIFENEFNHKRHRLADTLHAQ